MSDNAHTFYFGQLLPQMQSEGHGQEPAGGVTGIVKGNGSSQTLDTNSGQSGAIRGSGSSHTTPIIPIVGPSGPHLATVRSVEPAGPGPSHEPRLTSPPPETWRPYNPRTEFRADLVAGMDELIQDIRERKTLKLKTIYQILHII